jgi:hypothetical protein
VEFLPEHGQNGCGAGETTSKRPRINRLAVVIGFLKESDRVAESRVSQIDLVACRDHDRDPTLR